MISSEREYAAFLSYSHSDSKRAHWLHRRLEGYRVPRRLVGHQSDNGPIRARLGKIFCDRDELAVSADLSGKINEALRASHFLIVLCTPAAARSKWVNQEIINFKRFHGEQNILCVIAEGEPFADEASGGELECFAPSLRYRVSADGTLSDERAEPVAADLRPGGDGKRRAILKLVATMLGINLDELVRREHSRRQRLLGIVAVASLAGVLVMGALTWTAVISRDREQVARQLAEERRGQAEDLVEFLVGDLHHPLEEVGRSDVLAQVIERVTLYYRAQEMNELTEDSLGRWARTLHLETESRLTLGRSEQALDSAQRAHELTSELAGRDPANRQRLDEHGQSIFWLGQIYFSLGDYAAAADAMRRYSAIATALADEYRDHDEYLKTASRALYSLGAVLLRLGRPGEATEYFDAALPYIERLAKIESEFDVAVEDRAYVEAWRADALSRLGRLEDAGYHQSLAVEGFSDLHARYPEDKDLAFPLAEANLSMASLELDRGSLAEARGLLDIVREQLGALRRYDPGNWYWNEASALAGLHRARVALAAGQWQAVAAALDELGELDLEMPSADLRDLEWPQLLYLESELLRLRLHLAGGDRVATDAALAGLLPWARQVAVPSAVALVAEVHLLAGDLSSGNDIAAATNHWQQGLAALVELPDSQPPRHRALRLALAQRLGHTQASSGLRDWLTAAGYRHPLYAPGRYGVHDRTYSSQGG